MKRNKPLISVIVPVYNKKDYLAQCVDSILSQSYGNLEVLLVDDESTDGSGEICDGYAGGDERVRVFHQKNGGPTAAVMTGMREAAGGYYTFVDSDDYISADMLERMAACLAGHRGEIVCCNHVLEKQKETVPVVMSLPPGVYEGTRLQEEIKEKLLGRENRIIPMSRCMKLCEKSVFEGNEKYYDISIRMGDDFHLIYPALLNSTRVVVMEQALFYHYRYVSDSIVHRYDAGMYENAVAWRRAMERIVADQGVKDGEAKLRREYCYMLMVVMKNELRNPGGNYMEAVRRIFCSREVREYIANTPLSVRERSNQLMYLGMQYPEKALLRILRMIMKWYDRK